MEDLIERFCSVTGSDANVASHFLQMTNGDIDNAITFYFDSDPSDHSQVADSNNTMSQNMQPMEESRQPIPQKHERLIEPDISTGITVRTRSPLNRNVFNVDPQANLYMASGSSLSTNQNGSGSTLDKMFEPPTNLLFNGTFEEAKQHARNINAWLLVSVHNNDIFDCHRLNRDLWKNRNIIKLVKESFVLWQVLKNRFEAQNFVQWYRYDKDSAHLAVIDPVTGECKMSFIGSEIAEPTEMYKTLSSFIKYNNRSNNIPRKRTMGSDSDPECIDLTESIPRIKKMKILSPLSDFDDISEQRTSDNRSPENWLDYLGREEDPIFTILIRLPSGAREMLSIPSSSKLKALFLYIRDRGCDMNKYEMVKCFPKKILTTRMGGLTIESCDGNCCSIEINMLYRFDGLFDGKGVPDPVLRCGGGDLFRYELAGYQDIDGADGECGEWSQNVPVSSSSCIDQEGVYCIRSNYPTQLVVQGSEENPYVAVVYETRMI